jgi:hypothetical protein
MRTHVLAVAAFLVIIASSTNAKAASTACANHPFHVGSVLSWSGPEADQSYNGRRITKVYAIKGKTDARWCSLGAPGSCGAEPAWYAKTAGWLYETTGGRFNGRNHLWAANGYELDGPLDYIDNALASALLEHAIRCA